MPKYQWNGINASQRGEGAFWRCVRVVDIQLLRQLRKMRRVGTLLSARSVAFGHWQAVPVMNPLKSGGNDTVADKINGFFAGIPNEVIDSPAFADLTGETVRVLLILARQCNGHNNGRLQATYSYCRPRGIGSPHTLQDAIASLIAHGFIYRTRGHGTLDGKNIHATYALTFRPICEKKYRKSLFMDGFVANAWHEWKPKEKIPAPKKCIDEMQFMQIHTP